MSWTGTVTCSHCYETGHNRRGCLKLKEYIKENPNSYHARAAQNRKRTYATRACTYCKEPGHTRRTCSEMKRHKAEWTEHNKKWCGLMDQMLRERGIGVGTLIRTVDTTWIHEINKYEPVPTLSVVRGFDLLRMNFECSQSPSDSYALETYPVQNLTSDRDRKLRMVPYHPVLNDISAFYRERNEMAIVGPVECNNANPYGSEHYSKWLEGSLNVDAIFKERNMWNYPSEGYNYYCDLQNI